VIILTTLKKTLFWSYGRGTWQYDVVCVLILAFIFLTPNSIFVSRTKAPQFAKADPVYVSSAEIDPARPNAISQLIARHLSQKQGHDVTISRIELVLDDSGRVAGYRVWTEDPLNAGIGQHN
jgi:hypothetical protein